MKSKASLVPIKQSVSTKLFRVVFPLYLLIAIITTLLHMLVEFKNTKQHISQELVTVSSAIKPGLATAVWNIHREQVASIINGTERLPIITGIQIENDHGELLDSAGIVEAPLMLSDGNDESILDLFSDDFLYTSPLYYQKGESEIFIGKLTLHSNSQVVFQRVKLGFYLIVVNSLFKSLALLVLFIFFARLIISRPLQDLTDLIQDTHIDNLVKSDNRNLNTAENNELSLLKSAFNAMLSQLADAHEELKSHRDELEQKVAERTRELAKREDKLQTAYLQLQESRDKELKTLNDKKQFIADVSHELRTPISVLKLQLEALQQGISDDDKGYAVAQHKIDQMTRLIDDLYTLSRADINQLLLKYETFGISLFFEELLEPYRQLAEQKQLQLNLNGVESCNSIIRADWERLSQVFSNLLDNSLNYTYPSGEVRIQLKELGQQVQVIIEDSAPGVSDDDLKQLFKRLYRVDASRNRNTGGSGLGLAICESIIHAHGGDITLHHSTLGGIKVIITLPTTHVQEPS